MKSPKSKCSSFLHPLKIIVYTTLTQSKSNLKQDCSSYTRHFQCSGERIVVFLCILFPYSMLQGLRLFISPTKIQNSNSCPTFVTRRLDSLVQSLHRRIFCYFCALNPFPLSYSQVVNTGAVSFNYFLLSLCFPGLDLLVVSLS